MTNSGENYEKNRSISTYRDSICLMQILCCADAVSGCNEHSSTRDNVLKLALEQRQPVQVKQEGFWAPLLLQESRIHHQSQHCCRVDCCIRGGLPSQQTLKAHSLNSYLLPETSADPFPCSFQSQRAFVQLVLKFPLFIVDPMILYHWSNQSQPAQGVQSFRCENDLIPAN
jgi:hypothetical protein